MPTHTQAAVGLLSLAAAPEAWIAARLQWAAAVLPGLVLVGYVVAVAAARGLHWRYSTSASGHEAGRGKRPFPLRCKDLMRQQQQQQQWRARVFDIECPQPLLAAGSQGRGSLSTSPTALDIRDEGTRTGKYKPAAMGVAVARLASRTGLFRQICNGIVWLLAAECLMHTMLDFAFRQELMRRRGTDPQEIRLVSWLAFAQICITAAWLLQLRHRYAAAKCRSASMQRTATAPVPVWRWTAERECFWLLSLVASAYELYAYIGNGVSPLGSSGWLSPFHNTMLRTLISIRIALNAALVGCAAHGVYLQHRLHSVATAGLKSHGNADSDDSDDSEDDNGGPSRQLHRASGQNTYDTLHLTPSTTSTVSHTEVSETTPLVGREGQRQSGNAGDGVDNEDDDGNALRSGAKKVKMYHQSDDLSHDIMGLRQRLRLLMPFLWPSGDYLLQLRIFSCLLILVAGRVVNVLVPLQFKAVVDGLSPKDGSAPRFEWANVLLYAALQSMQGSVGILSTVQSFVWIPVGQATTRSISVAMFDHLHKLSLRFHVGRKTGEILRVQDRGVTSVVSLLRSVIFNVIPTLADIALACYFFSVMFDLYFGTIVFTTMASYLAVTLLLTGWRTRYRRRSNYLDNEMEARAVDSLLNFETVKYYNAEKFEGTEYGKAVSEFQDAEWFSNASMNLMNMGQNLIVQVGLLAGALLSAKRVYEGQMTVGDFTMLLSYIAQLYGPLNWFGTYYRVIQKNFIDMEKLLELFDEPVEVKDPVAPAPFEVPRGEVVFDNVSFSYDQQPTLKNVSFKVPAGSTVAIVGASGSGKSTILRLLFRFYDVQSGRILIDGQDIRSARQADLRQAIGIVPQDTVLFNDSIRYNIAYGRASCKSGVAMKEVMGAADAAHIHSRIMGFAEQYETRVGERGQRLSGGEKQRVAIARTLLKDPRIVCLDEATSALDTATERQIQTSLKEMTHNRTTLIIAHRLSTVIHADQILIVNDGEIVERGTHSELISDCSSVYYDMWMKQLADAANASYNPFLDSSSIHMSMQGAMTPDLPAGTRSPMSDNSAPGQLRQLPESAFESRPRATGNAMRTIGDRLHLALDDSLTPRATMSQGWAPSGPLTVPLASSMNHQDTRHRLNNKVSPTTTSSSSLSAMEPGALHLDIGTASIPVDGTTADDIQASPCDMSYGLFTEGDVLRLQQQLQQQKQKQQQQKENQTQH